MSMVKVHEILNVNREEKRQGLRSESSTYRRMVRRGITKENNTEKELLEHKRENRKWSEPEVL